jgi:tetratricopeptide (TPR) repeat protein
MHAGRLAAALAIGFALSDAAATDAQTVVAHVPAPGYDLRAQGETLEAQGDLLGAAALLEAALRSTPADPHLHWRIARDLLHHAERNPQLRPDERVSFYDRAREWAHAGRALAPDCAECCLYEFAGTARLASVRGMTQALGNVREAGQLLQQCLENPPHWSDASGSEEAALYYGASVYYRLMPDSTWMSWATGQRSDATRAVGLARRAVELEGERARYRLELAAALLCDGARREDAAALAEGQRWLADTSGGSGIDAERARRLRKTAPDQACELSHDDPVGPRD